MKFKNMKIAITDEAHLKAVCDVLGSMGYVIPQDFGDIVYTSKLGNTCCFNHNDRGLHDLLIHYQLTTLTDLLAMRDQLFMESIR